MLTSGILPVCEYIVSAICDIMLDWLIPKGAASAWTSTLSSRFAAVGSEADIGGESACNRPGKSTAGRPETLSTSSRCLVITSTSAVSSVSDARVTFSFVINWISCSSSAKSLLTCRAPSVVAATAVGNLEETGNATASNMFIFNCPLIIIFHLLSVLFFMEWTVLSIKSELSFLQVIGYPLDYARLTDKWCQLRDCFGVHST